MKRKKTILVIFFLFVIIMGISFAESRGNVTDFSFRAEKPVKFTMIFSDMPWYAYKNTWIIFDEIKKRTNVELDVKIIPVSDYNEKRNLLIVTGDAPYIMPKSYPGTENKYIPSGQILACSDYINDMPNFKASIKKWKLAEDLKIITQRDGKFYIFPGLHEIFAGQDYSLCVRTDILKKHNIKIPDSLTEIEQALRKLKKLYPKLYPMSDRWYLGCLLNYVGPAFGLQVTGIKTRGANWNNNNCLYIDEKTDKLYFYPTTKKYHDMLKYFARLVKDGLLDPESATQTDEQAIVKFTNGKSFFISCNAQQVNTYREKMDDTLGKGNYEIARINVPTGPAGGRVVGTRLENGIMIAAKAKNDPNFKTLLKFVDWLWYSYSGQELMKWGIEGKTYTFSNGKYSLKPGYCLPAYGFFKKNDSDIDIRKEYGFAGGNFILSYGGPKQLQYSFMNEEVSKFVELINKTRPLHKPAPTVPYNEDELEMQNMIQQPLMDYVFQMTYKFILGQSDIEKDWDKFVKQCKKKGSERYIKKANSVYKARKTR